MEPSALDVLIVEDDEALLAILAHHVAAEQWTVRTATTGDLALRACEERLPHVVVLDVMLPGMSGIDVCTALRARHHPSPGVLMLTARDTEADVILGFDSGADDYVVKPCRPRELLARLRALGRRAREEPIPSPAPSPIPGEAGDFVRGALRIDRRRRRVTVDDKLVRLTPTEFELLAFLAREPEQVYSRLELLRHVWDSTHPGYARNVDCHVTRLRRKIQAAGLVPAPIETVHGAGYRFASSSES
jgi:DNA-binding response OmpR family regulator